ncbi:hypothetical protein PAPYR_11306 [Paratrimastix pyriformis]|uniref:Uncharacterized protein n=1 Tax=Paratrimastix pyriformis TaxID=342808 RepID=A0ABQ8U419_9EUKA|nr:hypothetical protein PAPYR_11306 [Paratrimastix pyriformis]
MDLAFPTTDQVDEAAILSSLRTLASLSEPQRAAGFSQAVHAARPFFSISSGRPRLKAHWLEVLGSFFSVCEPDQDSMATFFSYFVGEAPNVFIALLSAGGSPPFEDLSPVQMTGTIPVHMLTHSLVPGAPDSPLPLDLITTVLFSCVKAFLERENAMNLCGQTPGMTLHQHLVHLVGEWAGLFDDRAASHIGQPGPLRAERQARTAGALRPFLPTILPSYCRHDNNATIHPPTSPPICTGRGLFDQSFRPFFHHIVDMRMTPQFTQFALTGALRPVLPTILFHHIGLFDQSFRLLLDGVAQTAVTCLTEPK